MKKTKSIIALLVIIAMVMAFIPFKVFAVNSQANIQLNGVLDFANEGNVYTLSFDEGHDKTVELTINNSETKNLEVGEGSAMLKVDVGSTLVFKMNSAQESITVDETQTQVNPTTFSYTHEAVAKAGNAPTIMDFNFAELGFDGTVIGLDSATVANNKITFDVDGVNVTGTVTGTAGTFAFNGNNLEVDDGALGNIKIKLDNKFKSNEMTVYVMDGNTRKEITVNGDNEITFNDVTITGKNLHLGIEKKGGAGQQDGGPRDIEFDVEFENTSMLMQINNVSVMDDKDGLNDGKFKGTVAEAGFDESDAGAVNVFKFAVSFGSAPVTEFEINGVKYKEGDAGVEVNEPDWTITVPAASKYIIRGKADQDVAVPRTIIWTNPNYVPQDAADAEWIKEFKLEHGYAYVVAVYGQDGKLVNPDNYKSQNWVVNENGGGVGSNGFGWITIDPNSRVVFQFVPEYGYQLTDIQINGQSIGAGDKINEFEFTMPNSNIHFDAEFTKTEDVLKANSEKVSSGNVSLGDNKLDGGTVQLMVNDVELSSDKIKGFTDAAGDYKISHYLDIDLYQVFYKGKDDDSDVWSNKIDELNNEVTITMKLADGVNADEIVIVHNVHDGDEYEIIQIDSYDPETNTITFRTKSFSNYAIAEKESKDVEEKESTSKNQTNPKTGDNIVIFIVIFAVALLGIFVVIKINKSNKKESKH